MEQWEGASSLRIITITQSSDSWCKVDFFFSKITFWCFDWSVSLLGKVKDNKNNLGKDIFKIRQFTNLFT